MDTNIDKFMDVVVIGSGFAGLSAAIEASRSGASVVVLEKMRAAGGNSIISDGGIAAAGTEEQLKYGIKDSPDLMYFDMLKAGLGLNNPELVRTVVNESKNAYEWTRDYLEVKYIDRVDIFGGHSVARCFTPETIKGSAIIKQMLLKLDQLGVEIKLGVHVTDYIQDNSRRITGVLYYENYKYRMKDRGPVKKLMAEKGVIIAAGGFGSDVEFRSAQDPRLNADIDATTKPFSLAGILKKTLAMGALPVHLSHIQTGPWASPDEKGFGDGPLFSEYIVFPYGIVIDPDTGKRFVNELADRKTVSDAILKTGHPCIGITDTEAVKKSGWDIGKALKKGVVRMFDSFKDAEKYYGIKQDKLVQTVTEFNRFVSQKNDSFFNKPIVKDAAEIKEFPLYGIRLWPKVHFTMGGIGINTRAQVLDLNGEKIPGLYAAGEVTGGVHGASRLGSCAITECFVFGRIAGSNAATDKC